MTTVRQARRTSPVGWAGGSSRDMADPWRHVDLILVGAVVAIACFGVLMVFSATRSRNLSAGLGTDYSYLQRQAVFVLLGLGVMALTALVDYRIVRDFAPVVYAVTIVVLLAVLSPLGSNDRGAQAWFQLGPFQLQPSEIAKVALIVCLAAYCAGHRGELDGRPLLTVLALAALPMLLIQLQPDLGTNLVFVAILLGVLLVAGVRRRHMAILGLLGVTGVVAIVQMGVLKDYQVQRLTAFVAPTSDVQRSTYNLDQSMSAIGSGGMLGKGLFKGQQTNLAYVPEQHTDFIFTAVGEQLGLAGSAVLLVLFAVLVWRTWRAAALAKDHSGTLICVGVLAMLVFQIFENVGMTMGIMPVTGIPLPLMSYGGSSTLATFAGMGLVLNVHMRRFS